MVRRLASLGAALDTPNLQGETAVHKAAQWDHVDVISVLAELGTDIDARAGDGTTDCTTTCATPLYVAAVSGHLAVVRTLAELGADVTAGSVEDESPVLMAAERGHKDISDFLTARMKPLLNRIGSGFVSQLGDKGAGCLFSWTMVVSSALVRSGDSCGDRRAGLEEAIASAFSRLASRPLTADLMRAAPYLTKQRTVQAALLVFRDSLRADGDRISVHTKARRFVELVCIFLDRDMLCDLLALRMTCKSNCDPRRFPVIHSDGQLEVNLIERFVGFDASRFMSTGLISQSHSMRRLCSTCIINK
jgi:hypothetical protein